MDTDAEDRATAASGARASVTEKILTQICIDPTDNSGAMTKFIQSVSPKSLLFMVTHDDGSSR